MRIEEVTEGKLAGHWFWQCTCSPLRHLHRSEGEAKADSERHLAGVEHPVEESV